MSININTPVHTDKLSEADLHIKTAATEVDAALTGGYQWGFFTGTVKVYDNYGSCGIVIPGLNVIKGAVGTVTVNSADPPNAANMPCLFQIASYNAGGPGTVYGQAWRWPWEGSGTFDPVPPATIGRLGKQLQLQSYLPINTTFQLSVLAWGTP